MAVDIFSSFGGGGGGSSQNHHNAKSRTTTPTTAAAEMTAALAPFENVGVFLLRPPHCWQQDRSKKLGGCLVGLQTPVIPLLSERELAKVSSWAEDKHTILISKLEVIYSNRLEG